MTQHCSRNFLEECDLTDFRFLYQKSNEGAADHLFEFDNETQVEDFLLGTLRTIAKFRKNTSAVKDKLTEKLASSN